MSKGKIKGPINGSASKISFDNRPLKDAVIDLLHASEVEVENREWQEGDKQLKTVITELEGKVTNLDQRIGKSAGNLADQLAAIKMDIEAAKKRQPLDIIVRHTDGSQMDMGIQHEQFKSLLKILENRLHVFLVGPAGSGKTHAAMECARALKIKFYFNGAIASEFKLTGFVDAHGKTVRTPFREAYEHGGLFLFDEIDASYPQALLAFNAALSNDHMDFPDGSVKKHKDFYCVAAANTYGQGADRQYVGRNQLDAASLDRFVFLDWKYDEKLERTLAGDNDWVAYVQRVRRFVMANKIRHVISPRASAFGAKLLACGISRDEVLETVLWKGLDAATKNKIVEGISPRKVTADHSGKFTAHVKVGQLIKAGDIIGQIEYSSAYRYNNGISEITSMYSGLIRSISDTRQVAELAVIAEIDSDELEGGKGE